nr:probable ADP-ribosylation factor GTPase-activating protein AGD14 [Ipomoea batatas]
MSSRREEERNEKIIRGLMKLPPNRRCINCDSLGPQYVCTNFWTFVCMTCSGIHREFTHRVKSVSMAKFTSQEVESLQNGGNQRARETFLKNWDPQRQRLPANSNVEKVREFIKNVYVDKRYAGAQSMDRPPRGTQNFRGHVDETRRASSYHSYSQSPPYDFQYEERLYGKHGPVLTRKPGSDRGLYEGKFSSFSSPSHLSDQAYEDRFANEGSNPRASDFSVSSGGDPFRSEQSPNYQRDTGFPGRPQRTASLGSFGSLENSLSINSASSFDLLDTGSEPEQSVKTHHNKLSPLPSLPRSSVDLSSAPATSQTIPSVSNIAHLTQSSVTSSLDLFQHSPISTDQTPGSHQMPQAPASGLDLFPEVPTQQSAGPSGDNTLKNEGWATFDMPQHTAPVGSEEFTQVTTPFPDANSLNLFSGMPQQQSDALSNKSSSDAVIHKNDGWAAFDMPQHTAPIGADTSLGNYSPLLSLLQGPSVQGSTLNGLSFPYSDAQGAYPSMPAPLHEGNQNAEATPSGSSEQWKAFENSSDSLASLSAQSSNEQVFTDHHPVTDQYTGLRGLENFANDEIQATAVEGGHQISSISSYVGGHELTNNKSTNPFDLPYESDMETNNMPHFWDMSSLQAALPNGELPTSFVGDVSGPWFAQDSVASYVPAGSEATLGFISAQPTDSPISKVPTQGPVAPVGGNPFA